MLASKAIFALFKGHIKDFSRSFKLKPFDILLLNLLTFPPQCTQTIYGNHAGKTHQSEIISVLALQYSDNKG